MVYSGMEAKISAMMKIRRNSEGHTLKALSDGVGLSLQYLHDMEAGRRPVGPSVVNKLADFYKFNEAERVRWHRLGALACGWEI
jgi:transcriptional regulator with XRE-family HTH domain